MKVRRLLVVLAVVCAFGTKASAQEAPAADAAPMPEAAPAGDADPMLMPAVTPEPMAAPAPAAEPAAPKLAPAAAAATTSGPRPALGADDVAAESDEEEEPSPCAIKDLCIGPVLSIGAINPLGIGAHARYGEHLGFGLDYQFIPSLTFSNASANWSLFTVEGRWYPFGGSFFLGGGFGYQNFNATATASDPSGVSMTVEGSVGVPALKLGLGFMGRSGFVMGIDLGFNIPLGGTDLEFNGAVPGASDDMVAQLRSDIRDAAKTGVSLIPVIPQLNLLRIGYLF